MPADVMTVRDTGAGQYEKPPEGSFAAVCADVIDLGFRFNAKFNKVEERVAIVFQLSELNVAGKRYEIAHVLTKSFHEKANLRKFLAQWRGKSYSDDEARAGAPLHKLENQPAYISIEHRVSGDRTYANIVGVMKLPLGLLILTPDGYTRSEHWKKGSLAEADQQRLSATIQGVPQAGPPNGSAPHPADDAGWDPSQLEDDGELDSLPF